MEKIRYLALLIPLLLCACDGAPQSLYAGGVEDHSEYRGSVSKEGLSITPDWTVLRTYVFDEPGHYLILYRVNPINNERYNVLFTVEMRRNDRRVAIAGENISKAAHYGAFFLHYAGYFQLGEWVEISARANSSAGMRHKSVVVPYESWGRERLSVIKVAGCYQTEGFTEWN